MRLSALSADLKRHDVATTLLPEEPDNSIAIDTLHLIYSELILC